MADAQQQSYRFPHAKNGERLIHLTGKPIAITGASSGIGAATAIACARAGMPVALGARRADKLNEVVSTIRAAGGRAIAVACDVDKPDDSQRLVDACRAEFGGLYAVYANAGYGLESAVASMSEEHVRAMFETNFFASLRLIWAALPHLRANQPEAASGVRGHVLMCSSCVAKMALPYYSVYSATKAAQNHVGRAMNLELAPEGIRVSTVHPIGTKTEFFSTAQSLTQRSTGGAARLISHTPDRFLQTPEFVAELTVRCLRRPKPEVWTGFKGGFVRFGMSVCTMFPWIADLSLRGMISRRRAQHQAAANS